MPGALDELGVGVALVGEELTIISACSRYAEMVGRTSTDVVGMTFADGIHPDDVLVSRWLLERALAHGDVLDVRKRFLRPDGTILWVEQRVLGLKGGPSRQLMVSVHPIKCRPDGGPAAHASSDLVEYVADMSAQLSTLAAASALPVTCDLLAAAARAAVREAGEDDPETADVESRLD